MKGKLFVEIQNNIGFVAVVFREYANKTKISCGRINIDFVIVYKYNFSIVVYTVNC